jgi:hypothetical protein
MTLVFVKAQERKSGRRRASRKVSGDKVKNRESPERAKWIMPDDIFE